LGDLEKPKLSSLTLKEPGAASMIYFFYIPGTDEKNLRKKRRCPSNLLV
jgi:hypothetical protein